jgi:disulfide bond formation protein DsbB
MRHVSIALSFAGAMTLAQPAAMGSQVSGDFNNDGFVDLAVGVPRQDIGAIADAGAVHVIYGASSGLSSTNSQFFSQDSAGVDDDPEPFDQFGFALAAGDFNKDGFDDLTVGVVGEDVAVFQGTVADAGAINVLYGTSSGLGGGTFWHQTSNIRSTAVDDYVEASDTFGAALAAGDLNGDGFDDLAVGVPGESAGATPNTGAVNILYGTRGGLLGDSFAPLVSQFWHQDCAGIAEDAESGDSFGSALTVANFGKSSHDDLAIGAMGESVGSLIGAGAVHVLYGTATGISANGSQLWHQNTAGIMDAAEFSDAFGEALAAANLGKSAHADLAVGISFENVGAVVNAGAVSVIYGTAAGLSAAGNQFWHQNSPGIASVIKEGDQFGEALAAADFGKSPQADLAIGVTGESLGTIGAAGAVHIIYGAATGLSATGDQFWHQNSTAIMDTAEGLDQFGFATTGGNFGGSSHADLAVGVVEESVGTVGGAGAVNVIYGGPTGLAAAGNQLWHQDVPGIADAAEPGDNFGWALSVDP